VTAVLADSHASLFAHGALEFGKVKATQGTGSSIMGLYDRSRPKDSIDPGICRTIAWQTDAIFHAFEGNIRSVGSTLVWLAALLDIDTEELARLAYSAPDNGGISLVPAFGGLGSPYWDAAAVGLIGGITQGTSRAQVARASVESIAHQIVDVLDSVRASGLSVERLYVDGGPTRNDRLMQFEADTAGIPVIRTETAELSAMGAAYLAGVGAGLWHVNDVQALRGEETVFMPEIGSAQRQILRTEWKNMVARSRGHSVREAAPIR
jgi:glycerol kinase